MNITLFPGLLFIILGIIFILNRRTISRDHRFKREYVDYIGDIIPKHIKKEPTILIITNTSFGLIAIILGILSIFNFINWR